MGWQQVVEAYLILLPVREGSIRSQAGDDLIQRPQQKILLLGVLCLHHSKEGHQDHMMGIRGAVLNAENGLSCLANIGLVLQLAFCRNTHPDCLISTYMLWFGLHMVENYSWLFYLT